MKCPRCESSKIIKNGRYNSKQRYKCKECNRHFLDSYTKQLNHHHRQHPFDHSDRIPEKVLILLTSHRSGSTWLSDAIRCHPFVEYHPQAIIYEKLGIEGRRYPGDLSNQADCNYEIEVQVGKLDKIPLFDVSGDLKSAQRQLKFKPYGIEKCHPSFFDFHPEIFLQGIEHLENLGIEVKLIYLVRDPKSLMTSFMDYQQRKPSWYKDMAGENLIDFISKTYWCIGQVSEARSSLILDYADTRSDIAQALLKIYAMLWSNLTSSQEQYLQHISNLALKYTNREQRLGNTNSPFLGKKEGTIRGGNEKYQDFFKTYQEQIEQCYHYYDRVINSK